MSGCMVYTLAALYTLLLCTMLPSFNVAVDVHCATTQSRRMYKRYQCEPAAKLLLEMPQW
jgi:hypothetical protein